MNRSLLLIFFLLTIRTSAGAQTYNTDFRFSEYPISEAGKWKNGKRVGVDWTDVRTLNGIACGSQTGSDTGIVKYNDSYACLDGFPPDQSVEGVVHYTHPSDTCNQEVELLLRWNSSAHWTTGYECLVRCLDSKKSYMEIVRWNGPLGDFTYITRLNGATAGIKDGDTLKASITGDKITMYVNNKRIIQGIDTAWKSGNPGIGFFLWNCTGTNTSFGFRSFTAKGL
jgi:hypothetical protein